MIRLHNIQSDDYRNILDNIPALLFINLPDEKQGWKTYYNKTWYTYTGLTPEDVEHGWHHVIHPDDIKTVTDVLRQALEKEEPYQLELRILSKETNQYNWFFSRAVPIRNKENKVIAWVGVSTDITPNKLQVLELQSQIDSLIKERKKKIKNLTSVIENLELKNN